MTVTEKMKNVKRVYEKTKDRSRDERSKKRTIANKSYDNNESVLKGSKNGMKDGNQESEKENKRREALKGAKDKFDRGGDQKLEKEKNTVKTTEELKNKFAQRRDNESKKERNIKKSIKATNCRSASTKDKEQRNDENIHCKEDKKRNITNNELLIKCNGKEKENIKSKIKRDSNAGGDEKRADAGCSVVYSPKNRLILRKVPHTTEQEILSHFQLADKARMFMKNDKFTGTVFLQFMNYKKTKKTLEDESLRNFNGHTIEIDYCLPREVYLKKKHLSAENAEDKQANGEKIYDKMKSCGTKKERSKIGETNCETKKDGVDDTTKKIKQEKKKRNTDGTVGKEKETLKSVEKNDKTSVKRIKSKEQIKPSSSKECSTSDTKITKAKISRQNGSPDTLYNFVVTNLAYNETEQSLKTYFDKFGILHEITIKRNNDGFCTGTAILAFTKMFRTLQNELSYNNRTVYIKFIKHNYRIFISGLKKTLTKELVIDYLSDKGYGVTDVLVPVGGDVKNRGYCFVQFDGENGVKRFKDEYRKYKGFFGTASRIEHAKRDEHDK